MPAKIDGATVAATAAPLTPRGDATSNRSARLNRHFAAESGLSLRREIQMRAIDRRAARQDVEGDRRGQLGAREREVQAVAGHRIDEPGRVAGEQQAGLPCRSSVDRHRAEHRRWRHRPGARKPRRQLRVVVKIAIEHLRRRGERGLTARCAAPPGTHWSGRPAPAPRRCNVRGERASRPSVVRPSTSVKYDAHGPSPRPLRLARQARARSPASSGGRRRQSRSARDA